MIPIRSLVVLALLGLALAACGSESSNTSIDTGYSSDPYPKRTGTSTIQDEWHRDFPRY